MTDSLSNLSQDWSNTRPYFMALVLCAALVFLPALGRRHFWGSDEPRVAAIGAEMVRTGDLITPRLNGEPFLEKPPLYFWTLAASFRLFGESHFAARVPPALAALGGVLLVFAFARRMGYSSMSAFAAGFVLATSMEYWSNASECITDMLLTFFTTGGMVAFYLAVTTPSSRMLWGIGFALSLAGAVMTKGLVGYAVPLSALFVWLLVEKDFSLRNWSLLTIGPALGLIPVLIWLVFLYGDQGREAVWVVVWKNNVARFTGGYPQHVNPFYYYLEKTPADFLPWTLFVPIALIDHFKAARNRETGMTSRFLLVWLFVPFILLSISAGKREIYLLPLYPAAALIVGTTIARVLEGQAETTRWFTVPTALLAAAMLIFPVGLAGVSVYFKSYSLFIAVAAAGLVLGILAFRRFLQKDILGSFRVLVVAITLSTAAVGFWILPLFNAEKSYVPLFDYCRQFQSEGADFVLYSPSERLRGAASFYLGKSHFYTEDPEAVMQILNTDENTMAICKTSELSEIKYGQVVKSFVVGHREYALLRQKERN